METVVNEKSVSRQQAQLHYEAELANARIECRQRNQEALKQYNAEKQRLNKELAGLQTDYQAERQLLYNDIDSAIATRNHLRRQGYADHSVEVEESYQKQRYAERNLADLKMNYHYDCNRIREILQARQSAYESLCTINAKWHEQRQKELREELRQSLMS